MKDKTRGFILDLLKDKAHEIKHEEFNGRSESQYKSFMELKESRISGINDCIQDLGLSNEWVCVDDRPRDNQMVLYCCVNGLVHRAKYLKDSDRFSNYGLRINPVDITHWQNLPLPPSEAKS